MAFAQWTGKQVQLPATRERFQCIARIGSCQPVNMIRPIEQHFVNFAESHAMSGSAQHQIVVLRKIAVAKAHFEIASPRQDRWIDQRKLYESESGYLFATDGFLR